MDNQERGISTESHPDRIRLNKIIGKNIVIERRRRAMTRDVLAELLDVSSSHMGLMERGERGVHSFHLDRISKLFGIPVGDLFVRLNDYESYEINAADAEMQANRDTLYALSGELNIAEIEFTADVIMGLLSMRGVLDSK